MNAQPDTQRQTFFPWPEKVLGPRPGLKEINLLCWGLFCLCVVAPACIVLALQYRTGSLYFEKTPVDFVYLYGGGQIENTHPAVDVYDYQLQVDVNNRIVPMESGSTYGVSPYPPFVYQFFRLFAKLSFENAFLVWFAISLLLYVAGVRMVLKEFLPQDRVGRSLILCFALASLPFLMDTLGAGQMSPVGLFFMSLAIVQERRGRPFLSGLALSVLLYKPTLLLFAIPMLVLTRRFRTLLGFMAGCGILAMISTLLAGAGIWPAYAHLLQSFGRSTGVTGQKRRLWKYVDLNSFSYAVPHGRSSVALALLACFVVAIVIWVAVVLWRSAGGDRIDQVLAWAVAIVWSMLINVYYPNYDSILLVIVVAVCLSTLRELQWSGAFSLVLTLAVLTFAIEWFTEPVAKRYAVQLLTFVILAWAATTTLLLQNAKRTVATTAPVPLAS